MSKPYRIMMKVAEHGKCDSSIHDDCNWEFLQETLQGQFIDMVVSKPQIHKNIVTIEFKTKTSDTIKKSELSWRLNDFFNHNRLVTLESFKLH